MQLRIGEEISRLRRERGLTQEQLAHAVGVSAPAVSKWENANAYPDIALLPPLARLLGVTVDELLAYQPQIGPNEVLEWQEKFCSAFEEREFEQARQYCLSCVREYPNSDELKFRTAWVFERYSCFAPDEEAANQLVRDAVALLQAPFESEDLSTREGAAALLVSLHMLLGECDRAEELLNSLPAPRTSPFSMLPTLYMRQGKLKEANKLSQQNLYQSLHGALAALFTMGNIALQEDRTEDALRAADTQRALSELFELENLFALSNYELYIKSYIQQNDDNSLLNCLEKYAEYISRFDFSSFSLGQNPFFDCIKTNFSSIRPAVTKKELIEMFEQDPQYDFIKNTSRFAEIVRKLKNGVSPARDE